MNPITATLGILFSAAFWVAVIILVASCQSSRESEFPKLTESEKQAFKILSQ